MLYKDTIFSISPIEPPAGSGINPKTNFLLKRARLLSTICDDAHNELALYKLHSGIYVVLTKHSNPIRSDSMTRVELYQVAEKFRLTLPPVPVLMKRSNP